MNIKQIKAILSPYYQLAKRGMYKADWLDELAEKIAALSPAPTDEELQREVKEEYPHDKPFNRAYTGIEVVKMQRLAYINGRKKSLERKTQNPTQ